MPRPTNVKIVSAGLSSVLCPAVVVSVEAVEFMEECKEEEFECSWPAGSGQT